VSGVASASQPAKQRARPKAERELRLKLDKRTACADDVVDAVRDFLKTPLLHSDAELYRLKGALKRYDDNKFFYVE
jgi:hypothetical protein